MDRIVIITGASSGIGRACAAYFGGLRDRVVLSGFRRVDALYSAAKEIRRNGGASCVHIGDLSDPDEAEQLLDTCEEAFGTPDILVNCAGISDVRLFQDGTAGSSERLFRTNLLSVISVTRAAVKRMLPRHSGRIISISSVYGASGASMEAEYAATKGGIDALTRSLAKELAPSGIAVNAVSPGAIDTPMNGWLTQEERAALEDEIPAGRMGTPEEVAEMVGLIASAPLYLTGAVIPFNGGWM